MCSSKAASSARPTSKRMANRAKPKALSTLALSGWISSKRSSLASVVCSHPLTDGPRRYAWPRPEAPFSFHSRRKPCLPCLQKAAVGSVARRARRNVIEDRFFRFSGTFSQQLQLGIRRTALPLWIWKIFGKVLPPQLQKLLLREKLLLVLPWLAPRIRQGESPPQRADRRTRSSDRA